MPSRNGSVTAGCGVCGGDLPAGRARAWCSDACRQAAWRRRHQPAATPDPVPPTRPAKDGTVYECDACGIRLLGQQQCDCGAFMRRVGRGGNCPHCEEAVAISDLVDP